MIQYRTYLPGDEQVIVELWNSCLETDPTTPKRFRRLVLLDAADSRAQGSDTIYR